MERFIKVFLTLVLSCIIGLAGTLWVYGEENGEDDESLSGLYARAAVLARAPISFMVMVQPPL